MGDKKKAVNLSGLNAQQTKALSRIPANQRGSTNEGTFGEPRPEAVPNYIQTESEHVISNKNNSWIVLGRDRPRGIASGYGGRGDTGAASIDLCVGRMSANPISDAYVDPNFRTDAARIYISQKTDVDENFNLTEGTLGMSETKSAVAIKADGVRIIAREGIKLVTTTDSLNSQGGRVKSLGNIDLIAGNNTEFLEPAVKGKQLANMLRKLLQQVSDLTENMNGFLTSQMAFNSAMGSHIHPVAGAFVAPLTGPSPTAIAAATTATFNQGTRTVPSLLIAKTNKIGLEFNCLNELGEDYILSRNVNLT
tara:strand:- start:1823 stop:2746 length:924 start_codon:yes stop_codon:yes gene_type:complete